MKSILSNIKIVVPSCLLLLFGSWSSNFRLSVYGCLSLLWVFLGGQQKLGHVKPDASDAAFNNSSRLIMLTVYFDEFCQGCTLVHHHH